MNNQIKVRNSRILNWAVDDCLKKTLGQILLEAGLISINQLEIALKEQQESGLKIGEMLSLYGWIDKKTADFFAEQWKQILQQKEKKPLVYYFRKSGLLTEEQITDLLAQQQSRDDEPRFHHLVVEHGLLKQTTVDYFLTYLFGFYSPNTVSLDKPYEILKNYVQGKTDFTNSNLVKIPLMNVSLKKIRLDSSNLRKANFHNSDLSYSTFTLANLSRADLSQAILLEADLEQTNLKKANLRGSSLEKANLKFANLQNADLRNACLNKASFEYADLQGAILMENYAYEVYYNDRTIFDADFSPEKAGWRKLNIADI